MNARADGFATEVETLLQLHREGQEILPNGTQCEPCRRSWPEHRRHLGELICAARTKADDQRARTPRVLTEILMTHAPYNNPAQGLVIQCPTCVDGQGGGIYSSTLDWARHIEIELARAGLRVTKARP